MTSFILKVRNLLATTLFNNYDSKTPMRKKFLRWLVVYAVAAFIAALSLSLVFETRTMRREFQLLVDNKIKEAYEHTRNAQQTLETLKKRSAQAGITRARIVALALQAHPELVASDDSKVNTENLTPIAEGLDVDEIDIINEYGICEATWPENATLVGYDYHNAKIAKEFLAIIDDPTLEISQDIRETEGALTNDRFQFSAVPRKDKRGFVEVGFKAVEVEKAYHLADVSRYVGSTLGACGFFSVFQDGKQSSSVEIANKIKLDKLPLEHVTSMQLDDERYLLYAAQRDEWLFVGGIKTSEIFSARRPVLALLVLSNFIIFLVIFTLVSALVQRLIVDGVYAINTSLEKITKGDLEERVCVETSKEFVELSNGVNATVDSLKQVVEEIKERGREELALAKRIQEAALPKLENLFVKRVRFDVCGRNRPMASVGGDMYDFFFLDGNTVLFYVADVSGHGVPASLVMMKTMALVKNLALSGYPLEKVVATTNYYLSENNDSSFVTGFFCTLNLLTGVMTYVNAGHNAPFIKRAGGSFDVFDPEINLIMGIEPEFEYQSATTNLEPGDVFILYSDGITEATTPAIPDCFENDRALAALNGAPATASAIELVQTLFDAVDEFTGRAEPSDDETVLVLKYIAKLDKSAIK